MGGGGDSGMGLLDGELSNLRGVYSERGGTLRRKEFNNKGGTVWWEGEVQETGPGGFS